MANNRKADECVEWTYERREGDIVVFAKNAAEALATIREYGFLIINPERLKRTDSRHTDRLKKDEIT